jgi:hypothetical protein
MNDDDEKKPGRHTRQAFHRFIEKKLPSWEHCKYYGKCYSPNLEA